MYSNSGIKGGDSPPSSPFILKNTENTKKERKAAENTKKERKAAENTKKLNLN